LSIVSLAYQDYEGFLADIDLVRERRNSACEERGGRDDDEENGPPPSCIAL
jgi:hypothetical protein